MKGTLKTTIFGHSNKTKVQLLGSRLKQWKLLEKSVTVSFDKNRLLDVAPYC